jgi:hypothetical protein
MAGDKGKKRSRKKRSRTDMKGNNVEDGDSNEYQSAQKKSKDKKDVDLGHGNGDQSEIMKSKSQPLLCVGTSCNLSDRLVLLHFHFCYTVLCTFANKSKNAGKKISSTAYPNCSQG